MIGVIRHTNPLFPIILLIATVAGCLYLSRSGIHDPAAIFQTLFGGKPLQNFLLQSLFVMTFIVLQLALTDHLVYCIDNFDYLSVRYGNQSEWLKALITGALILTAAFVVLVYVIGLLFCLVTMEIKITQAINLHAVGVIARVYLFCAIAALTQICLLMKYTKSSVFTIMSGIAIFLALTNRFQDSVFYILPRSGSTMTVGLDVLKSIVLAIALIALIQRTILKRELPPHEN